VFDRVDALTRPAAISIALFVAMVLLRSARADLRARLAALSAAGTALFCSASPGLAITMAPIVPPCIGNSVFFWWFVRSLFEDDFQFDRWALAPFVGILALGLGRIATGNGGTPMVNGAMVVARNLLIAGLMGNLFYIACILRDRALQTTCWRLVAGFACSLQLPGALLQSGSPLPRLFAWVPRHHLGRLGCNRA
jgi:hypothetical protein